MLIEFVKDAKPRYLNSSIYGEKSPLLYGGLASPADMNNIMNRFPAAYWDLESSTAASIVDFDLQHFAKRSRSRKGAFWLEYVDAVNDQYTYLAEVATKNRDITPILINQMNVAIIRNALNNNNFNIDVWLKPFKRTSQQNKNAAMGDGAIGAFVFSMALVSDPLTSSSPVHAQAHTHLCTHTDAHAPMHTHAHARIHAPKRVQLLAFVPPILRGPREQPFGGRWLHFFLGVHSGRSHHLHGEGKGGPGQAPANRLRSVNNGLLVLEPDYRPAEIRDTCSVWHSDGACLQHLDVPGRQ